VKNVTVTMRCERCRHGKMRYSSLYAKSPEELSLHIRLTCTECGRPHMLVVTILKEVVVSESE